MALWDDLHSNELLVELWEQYQEAETQFGDDYFWDKHGHKDFIARFRAVLKEDNR